MEIMSSSSFSEATPSCDSVESLSRCFTNLDLNNGGNIFLSSPTSNAIERRIAALENFKFTPLEIVFLAENEIGSQFLIQSLSLKESRIVDKIFDAVFEFVFGVLGDQFGHLVFAELIKSCSYYQLQLITLKITSHDDLLYKASIKPRGSSSIKRLIRVVSTSPLLDLITSALKRLFKHIMTTKSGSSIILYCLQTLKNHQNDNIYLAALEDFDEVSCHKHGCTYMNNFIDEMNGRRRKQLLHLICINSASLSKDPYGNFVIQHVLGLENPELIEVICMALKGIFVDLSARKEGSYIVEVILNYPNLIEHVVDDFLHSDRILEVANDRFGNYVIQTALKATMIVDFFLFQRLVMKLLQEEDLDSLRFGYGKNVFKFITCCGIPVPQLPFV